VVVPDKHLSLAIGKDGQNARLAAKLTGWRIDIKSASSAEAEKAAKAPPPVEAAAVEAPPVKAEAPAVAEPSAAAEAAPAPVQEAPPAEKPLTPEEKALLDEMIAESKETEAKGEEEGKTETVLSSTFIPKRIIQPREDGKTQIRFAEDIFSNRPNRSEDKPRKKKKKFSGKGREGGDEET
jgi:transcription termination/antitermination protein NusA